MGIRNLSIENFRGIKSMSCDRLSRITLIGGRNNCGKTSVLEAIKILSERRDASTGANINSFFRRIGLQGKEDLRTLFNDSELPFVISSGMCNGITCSVTVELERALQGELPQGVVSTPDSARRLGWELHHRVEDTSQDGMRFYRNSRLGPRLDEKNEVRFSYTSAKTDERYDWKCMLLSGNVRSSDSDVDVFSKMTVALQDRDLSQIISRIYPEIYTVKLVNDQIMVKVRGYDNLLPAKVAGDGVTRMISVLCCLWNCKDGCLCVDEIDNGLHYSVLLDFWKAVAEFADRFNVQIVATTHHQEMLETLSRMVRETNRMDETCYLRLVVDDEGRHQVSRFSGEDLDRALDMGFELRG